MLLSTHFGKILLGLSSLFFVWVTLSNRAPETGQEFPSAAQIDINKTQVKLVIQPGNETVGPLFEPAGRDYTGRNIFPTEKPTVKQYEAVELGVPEPLMPRAPQVLSSPGPSLSGAEKFPRWNEELGTLPPAPEPKRSGTGLVVPATPGAVPVAPGGGPK